MPRKWLNKAALISAGPVFIFLLAHERRSAEKAAIRFPGDDGVADARPAFVYRNTARSYCCVGDRLQGTATRGRRRAEAEMNKMKNRSRSRPPDAATREIERSSGRTLSPYRTEKRSRHTGVVEQRVNGVICLFYASSCSPECFPVVRRP